MTEMHGIPAVCQSFPGIDAMGFDCRVDPTVSIMRFGPAAQKIVLGDRVSLYGQTRLVVGDVQADPLVGVQIGAGTIVNVGCYLSGEGGLSIGPNVLIGPHAKLLSAGHEIDQGHSIIAKNAITRSAIVIEEGAWIGAGAIVLEGVRIGRGAVVAAGALVRTSVPDGMIAAGVPAALIRARGHNASADSSHSVAARLSAWWKSLFR